MKCLGVFLFVVVVVVVAEERVRYDGHKVFELTPETEQQFRTILSLESKYDVWRISRNLNSPTDVMVRPHQMKEFEDFLTETGIRSRIKIQNVQELIDQDERGLSRTGGVMEWTKYHPLEDIYNWMDELSVKYPHVKVVVVGRTYENRSIKALDVTFGPKLPVVVIDSTIHAREWLAPASTSWMMNEIVKCNKTSIFRKYNYLYVPVLNPDGYVHSWTTNRMWRKTRTPYKTKDGRTVYGADPNRNFDSHWKAANNPESEIYPGPKPFSEIEIKTFSDYLKKSAKEKKLDIFFSYHTYGNILQYPWDWTTDPAPLDKRWNKVAVRSAEAVQKVHGIKLKVGEGSRILYACSGTTGDWYYEAFNATYAFLYEMRGKSFVVEPENIIPCGEDHLVSLESLLKDYPTFFTDQ